MLLLLKTFQEFSRQGIWAASHCFPRHHASDALKFHAVASASQDPVILNIKLPQGP
jgi:hypothetical protein